MRKALTGTNFTNIVILLILVTGAWLRTGWYGDLRLSIGNAETGSYISSSRASLLSWKILAGQRLFTTNMIFKVANDEQNCSLTAQSLPALGLEGTRANQACFNKIALFQNILAILGWSFLAWTTAKWMHHPFTKIIAASSIMLFGFTPQIAEWDSILSPESLSLSMFAITLALAQEIVFRTSTSTTPLKSNNERSLLAGGISIFLLWVFVRDVHLYAIPIAYGLFLISHLRFVTTTLWEYMELLTSDFVQPYFVTSEVQHRDSLLTIGEMFHPQTAAVYLIDVLLLLTLLIRAFQLRTPTSIAWSWLAVWFFAIATATLFFSYFGDTSGLRRHIMPSVEMFRLLFWVLIVLFLDLSLDQFKQIEQ